MALQGNQTLTAPHIPEGNGPVKAAAGQQVPIVAQRQAKDATCMTLYAPQTLSTAHLPEQHHSVVPATGQEPPIGAQRHGKDGAGLSV
jgi:hypothetical protein